MGLRFRKSIKIAPGVRLNLGKKSSSISFGGKGMRHTISSTGRRTTTVGIPGSGLSYSHTHGSKKPAQTKSISTRQGGNMKKQKSPTICKKCGAELSKNAKVCRYCRAKVKKPAYKKWWVWLLVLALLGSCVGKDEAPAEQTGETGIPDAVVSDDTPIEQPEPEEVPVVVEPVPDDEQDPVVDAPVDETPVETQPAVEETPVYEEPVGTDYVLNTNSKKFHYTWCDSVSQMSEKNKAFHTGTRDELIASGYKACKNCNP